MGVEVAKTGRGLKGSTAPRTAPRTAGDEREAVSGAREARRAHVARRGRDCGGERRRISRGGK